MNDFLTRKIKVNGHVDVVLVYTLSLEQTGPSTLEFIRTDVTTISHTLTHPNTLSNPYTLTYPS